jgi:hypothetical protein
MAGRTHIRVAGSLAICLTVIAAPAAFAGGGPPVAQPDALIRLGSGSYVGDGIINNDATGQQVSNSGVVGQKLTFFIAIQNDGALPAPNGFKVRRSCCFHEGYRVRYYDANGTDVTGKVTAGTFTTPAITPGGPAYVMRATVKIRALATSGSSVTRLITVRSDDFGTKDAVRFTAALG